MTAGGTVVAAAPDDTVLALGTVALAPERLTADSTFEQAGELVIGSAAVVGCPAFDLDDDELVCGP